jgi:lipid A disaccharide synthetase
VVIRGDAGRDACRRLRARCGVEEDEAGIGLEDRKIASDPARITAPQIWASRAGRLATIRAVADRVLVIFPFEEALYRQAGVPVEFVGHQLIDLARPSLGREPFLTALGLAPSVPPVAVLDRQGDVRVDLSDPGAVRSAAGQVLDRYGRCDVLVHAAAMVAFAPFAEFELDVWRQVQAVNVESVMLLAQAFVPGMR